MLLLWKTDERKYANGTIGYLGKWMIMEIGWSMVSNTDNKKWVLKCFLPGIKENLGNFLKQEEAEIMAEAVTKYWLKRTNVSFKEK